MTKILFASILAAIVLGCASTTMPRHPAVFGRVSRTIGNNPTSPGTNFGGRADDANGNKYRRVTLSFGDSHIIVHADELVYDENAKHMTLRGNVSINLDSE